MSANGHTGGTQSFLRLIGERAGTVTVTLDATEGGSDVEVAYELTPLSEEGARHLEQFADGYGEYLRSWQDAIAASLQMRAAS